MPAIAIRLDRIAGGEELASGVVTAGDKLVVVEVI
jgi:hypothetical protein